MSDKSEILKEYLITELENGLPKVTNSGVRIYHKPTGLLAYCDTHLSRHKNEIDAFNIILKRMEILLEIRKNK